MLLKATRLGDFPPWYIELMSKDQDFGLQSCPRADEPEHRAPDQSAEIAHWSDYQPIRRSPSAALEFAVGTGRVARPRAGCRGSFDGSGRVFRRSSWAVLDNVIAIVSKSESLCDAI